MIKNQDGKVAVKWILLQRNPPPVKIDGTDRIYIFTPKSHVFMAWVEDVDVSKLLVTKSKVCNCNNGTYKIAFELASRLDVMLWDTGSRDGVLNPNYSEV
jgi:hypothetical protein